MHRCNECCLLSLIRAQRVKSVLEFEELRGKNVPLNEKRDAAVSLQFRSRTNARAGGDERSGCRLTATGRALYKQKSTTVIGSFE